MEIEKKAVDMRRDFQSRRGEPFRDPRKASSFCVSTASRNFVEKGFDTNDPLALNQSPSVIPLAYEFFTLSRRPQRAGTANAIVVA